MCVARPSTGARNEKNHIRGRSLKQRVDSNLGSAAYFALSSSELSTHMTKNGSVAPRFFMQIKKGRFK
jgi:hypothetical protein